MKDAQQPMKYAFELHNVPRGALSRVIKEFITRDKVPRNTSWEIYSRLLVAQTHVAVLFPTCGKVSRSTPHRLFPHVGKYAAARRADMRLPYIIIYTRVRESGRECGEFSCFSAFLEVHPRMHRAERRTRADDGLTDRPEIDRQKHQKNNGKKLFGKLLL